MNFGVSCKQKTLFSMDERVGLHLVITMRRTVCLLHMSMTKLLYMLTLRIHS